jgi:hypothetical protein
MNQFEGQGRAVAALYNDSDKGICGCAAHIATYDRATALLGGQAFAYSGRLEVCIEPGDVLWFTWTQGGKSGHEASQYPGLWQLSCGIDHGVSGHFRRRAKRLWGIPMRAARGKRLHTRR